MNMHRRFAAKLIVSSILMLSAAAAKPTVVIPPAISDLSGDWIGQAQHGEFARLTLSNNGSGVLALNYYRNQPIWLYRVKLSKPANEPLGWTLVFTASPIGHKHGLVLVDAKASGGLINFKIKGDVFNSIYTLPIEPDGVQMPRASSGDMFRMSANKSFKLSPLRGSA